ncbi:MAG: O-antigen ligase family protein [Tenericutes bacterium]|nr:O-antigen ligase family protein [Mycoplasmatota bacterium]
MTEKNFFTKLPYLIFISILTFFFWYKGLESIGFTLFLVVCFFILIFFKNTIHIIPFLFNAMFMISQTEWDVNLIPLYIYATPVVMILGMVIHAIRFKVNLFRGKFMLGIALYGVAMIASTIVNTEVINLNTILLIFVAIFFVLLYGFFANTIQGDNQLYLIRVMVILGLLISFEVFAFYLQIYLNEGSQAVHFALEHKEIDLGWGISNFIATYLIMFIAAITYFVKKYKLHIFWIVLALFEISMLLFTLSRAGILAFLGTSVFLILYMFIKYDHKLALLLNLFLGVLVFAGIIYLTRSYFIIVIERFESRMLDDTGRIELWKEAIVIIKSNPVFGKGVFARAVAENELRMFHNTILHTLACFGAIGGLALVIQFISILRIFFYKFNQEKAILLIALIGANIHGMVDNVYLMPQYMILMFVIIAVVENAGKIDKLREELRVG